ncbi:hypothetical protein FC18_GL001432 [Lacticaseibacillus sharpeae JCM 1186 = DSM 20505]|uniref:Uncharacterized protein n=1 Tax=Lacticaseibacillus sharpeae JCM 1186 = DSM 20505 TaxID=1291052 RepID=A0A0R1ZJY7_9LACO|nr:hypothetical protein FC18_GL001432 [Lacticaseibacillus sharpeae JCM 1186 = DSM 20505]
MWTENVTNLQVSSKKWRERGAIVQGLVAGALDGHGGGGLCFEAKKEQTKSRW